MFQLLKQIILQTILISISVVENYNSLFVRSRVEIY